MEVDRPTSWLSRLGLHNTDRQTLLVSSVCSLVAIVVSVLISNHQTSLAVEQIETTLDIEEARLLLESYDSFTSHRINIVDIGTESLAPIYRLARCGQKSIVCSDREIENYRLELKERRDSFQAEYSDFISSEPQHELIWGRDFAEARVSSSTFLRFLSGLIEEFEGAQVITDSNLDNLVQETGNLGGTLSQDYAFELVQNFYDSSKAKQDSMKADLATKLERINRN